MTAPGSSAAHTALIQRIDGRPVVLGMSTGKDSGAAALHLRELGIPFTGVFLDTGWESAVSYRYLDEVLEPRFGPILRLRSAKFPGGMTEIAEHKSMFPSKQRRYCTQELKVFPLRDYLRGLDAEPVSVNGIRRAESEKRANMPEWEWNDTYGCEEWRPLVEWTEADVIEIHRRHNLAPNPLYLAGALRVGCWPCINSRKAEIKLIARTDPGRIDQLRVLEARVTDRAVDRAAERAAAKDSTLEEMGHVNPAFFVAKTGRGGQPWPIDKVVRWSRTLRGGRKYELFADLDEPGCVRWGLCETLETRDG